MKNKQFIEVLAGWCVGVSILSFIYSAVVSFMTLCDLIHYDQEAICNVWVSWTAMPIFGVACLAAWLASSLSETAKS